MNLPSRACLFLAPILSAGLAGSCASAHRPAASVVPETDHCVRVEMLDVQNGWAETSGPEGFRVLRTSDGTRTWEEVTPEPLPFQAWACEFARASTAWITVHTNSWAGLLMTTDAGKSWANVTTPFGYFTEASAVRFYNANFGVGKICDGGLGSSSAPFMKPGTAERTGNQSR